MRLFINLFEKILILFLHSSTALAEAELEYDPKYESTQIYLSIPLTKVPDEIKSVSSE